MTAVSTSRPNPDPWPYAHRIEIQNFRQGDEVSFPSKIRKKLSITYEEETGTLELRSLKKRNIKQAINELKVFTNHCFFKYKYKKTTSEEKTMITLKYCPHSR